MQANSRAVQRLQNLQLAVNCNFSQGTEFAVYPRARSRGFVSSNVDIGRGTKIRFSDGAVYKDDLGGAIAHAGTDVNLVPFFQQLSGGQEGLDYAANIGLPPGFVAAPVYNDDRAIVRVNIYSKTGDWYCNYHLLAPLGIDVANITCAFWQERLRNAVDNHLPNDGWSIVLKQSDGYIHRIYSPSGDQFNSLQAAWVTAGVIFPPELLLEAMREFIRIVESLTNGSVTRAFIARLIDISSNAVKRFLDGSSVRHENIYKINLVFGQNYDINALTNAARDAGVLDQQIHSFELDMATFMQRLSLRARAFPLPEPFARARDPTNEYEGWANANANAPRVVVGQQLNQIQVQEAVVAEAPAINQADLPPLALQEAVVAEAPINQVGLPPLPLAFQGAAAEAINQVGPHLQAQAQVQVNPPQDAEEEPANFVAV